MAKRKLTQKQIFNGLYLEYTKRYNLPFEDIVKVVNQALTKTFNSALPIILNDKNITITKEEKGYYISKIVVISSKNEKIFSKILNDLITKMQEKRLNKILKKHFKQQTTFSMES